MVQSLIQAFDILEKLESTSSRNEKMEIIKEGKENIQFLFLLEKAYNPFIRFHIHNFEELAPTENEKPTENNFKMFEILLRELSQRVLTGNEALNSVKLFFGKLNKLEQKWYGRVIKKDLRVGATSTTFNKVLGASLIPTFDCMLAKSWEEIKNKPEFIFVEPKFDGYRALAFVENSNVSIVTRNGKEITGFSEIEKELSKLPSGYIYDGEIVGTNKESVFQEMQKSVFKKEDNDKKGNFNLFDIIKIEEFVEGKSKQSLSARKSLLKSIVQEQKSLKFVRLVEFAGPMKSTSETVDMLYQMYLSQGYEGMMLKDAVGKYECKRSNGWAKVKPSDTFDLEIIGVLEGEGKHVGKLGAFVVDYKGNKVNVGSGYTDKQRTDFWNDKENMLGKLIEVEAQETTTNEKGGESLRFPVFKKVRYDK